MNMYLAPHHTAFYNRQFDTDAEPFIRQRFSTFVRQFYATHPRWCPTPNAAKLCPISNAHLDRFRHFETAHERKHAPRMQSSIARMFLSVTGVDVAQTPFQIFAMADIKSLAIGHWNQQEHITARRSWQLLVYGQEWMLIINQFSRTFVTARHVQHR